MGLALPNVGQFQPIIFHPSRDQFQSEYVQRIKQTPFIDSMICNNNPLLFADPIGITLSQEMEPYKSSTKLVSPQMVIKIMVNVARGMKQLSRKGYLAYGDINIDNIYLCPLTKHFKLVHPSLCVSGYKMTMFEKRFSALSPEQLSAIRNNKDQVISYPSDIFSFGIWMTEICTLLPCEDIYDFTDKKIINPEIEKRAGIIKKYYPLSIANVIINCLNYDFKSRINLNDLIEATNQIQKVTF